MRVATSAERFGTHHAQGTVCFIADCFWRKWLPKAGPACAGIKFCIGTEEFQPAVRAFVYAFAVIIPVFACKSAFGAFFTGYMVLLRSQLFTPFGFGFDDFGHSGSTFLGL